MRRRIPGLKQKEKSTQKGEFEMSVTTDQDAIVSEIYIAANPERVFQALVDPAQVVQW